MTHNSLTGLVLYSHSPMQLAEFYRTSLGIPLEPAEHGAVGAHLEAMFGNTHIAVWDVRHGHAAGALVPVFRTPSLDLTTALCSGAGAECLHKPLELGEGKRVVTLRDPDGRAFRLIEFSR